MTFWIKYGKFIIVYWEVRGVDSLIPIVLVIDDGPNSSALVERAVREQELRVVAVNNADDARVAFQEEIPNIVVLNACLNGGVQTQSP